MTSSRLNAKARAYMKTNPDVNYTAALSHITGAPLISKRMSDILGNFTGGGKPAPDLKTAMQNLGFQFPPSPNTATPITAVDVRQGDVVKTGERYGLLLDTQTILLDGKIVALSDLDAAEFFRLPDPPDVNEALKKAKRAAEVLLSTPPHAVWMETSVPLYAVQRGDVVQFENGAGVYLGKGDIQVKGETLKLTDVGTPVAVFRMRYDTAPHNPDTPEGVSLYSLTEGDIAARWRRNEFTNDLHVPLGYDVSDNRVFGINIAESSTGGTGPHGVIQGSMGTGKSTLATNIILALSADNSPTKVTFAVAESRGSFTSVYVEGLPHGARNWRHIEDDKDAQSDFKDYILEELKRREDLLYEMRIPNIAAYTAAREKDDTLEPLPHLIIVTDMARIAPYRVMSAMQDVASKERSLGVHLLVVGCDGDESLNTFVARTGYGITFRCSESSSRRILGGSVDGAKLAIGRGDALVRYKDAHGNCCVDGFRALRNGENHASDRVELLGRIARAAEEQG